MGSSPLGNVRCIDAVTAFDKSVMVILIFGFSLVPQSYFAEVTN